MNSTRRFEEIVVVFALVSSFVLLVSPTAAAQAFWPPDTPKLPMTKTWQALKAKLPPYTPPRTPDGVPDFQGVWGDSGADGQADLEDHEWLDVTTPPQESVISDPPDQKVPYLPWARAIRDQFRKGLARGWPGGEGPRSHIASRQLCLHAMPRIHIDGGQEIIQKPGYVIIVSTAGWHRVIPTDGRPHVGGAAVSWFGSSRGRWEGDTLVVEVRNLNGKGWFDYAGNFMTVNTHLVERWRLADANTIDYELTVEDPTTFSRSWKMNYPKRRDGTPPPTKGPQALPGATSGLPFRATNPHDKEVWEEGCFEGNHENTVTLREIGYKWFNGVTPPQ